MSCRNVPEVGARLAGGACAVAAVESASTIAMNIASLVFIAVPPMSLTKSAFLLRKATRRSQ